MVPWQVATGLTMVVVGVSALLLTERMDYLQPYWRIAWSDHGWWLAPPALTAVAGVFAAIHWGARKIGLGDLGRKVEHLDRGLQGEMAHDAELAEALRRDRRAEWGPGGSAS